MVARFRSENPCSGRKSFAMSVVRIRAAVVGCEHRAERNQIDVRGVEAQAAAIAGAWDVAAPVADVGQLEQAGPGSSLGDREAIAVCVRLLIAALSTAAGESAWLVKFMVSSWDAMRGTPLMVFPRLMVWTPAATSRPLVNWPAW